MNDPRPILRQMQPPYAISQVDILRDGGTIMFEVADAQGAKVAGTLVTPFRGIPRLLTVGFSTFEEPNLIRIHGFALTPGGPTEAVVFAMLESWLAASAWHAEGREYIEKLLSHLQDRLDSTEVDEITEEPEKRVRTLRIPGRD